VLFVVKMCWSLQQAANDPERLLSNRGCRVMIEEKERNLLMKKLPKVYHLHFSHT